MKINLTLLAHNPKLLAKLEKALTKQDLLSVREFLLRYFPSKFLIESSSENIFDAADVILSCGDVVADGDDLNGYLNDLTNSLHSLLTNYYRHKQRAVDQYNLLKNTSPNFIGWSKRKDDLPQATIDQALVFLNANEAYYSYLDGYQAQKKNEISYLLYYIDENQQQLTHDVQTLFNVDSSLHRA